MEKDDGHIVDSVFGQSRAFALNDKLVNPEVVRYLNNVRQEALRTHVARIHHAEKYKASLYDDEQENAVPVVHRCLENEVLSNKGFKNFQSNTHKWLEWFENAKQAVLENTDVFQGYDERTIDLLMHYLKNYLRSVPEQKGIVVHLLRILENHRDIEEDETLEIDETWAISIVRKLKNKKIKNLEDLKKSLKESNQEIPVGFKQWYQYLQEHEPTHTIFVSVVNSRNIWVLVQYMSREWIKDIVKFKKPEQAIRLSNWLLYIMFHLPVNITADCVSNLRDLGQKCHRLVKEDLVRAESEEAKVRIPQLQDSLPSEMTGLEISPIPIPLNIIELTLTVIAIVYRQRDLLNWD